jgi:hypothetical protein
MRRILLKILPSAAVPVVDGIVPLRRLPSEQQVRAQYKTLLAPELTRASVRTGVWAAAMGWRCWPGCAVDGAGEC